jgi:hypothetical protein
MWGGGGARAGKDGGMGREGLSGGIDELKNQSGKCEGSEGGIDG